MARNGFGVLVQLRYHDGGISRLGERERLFDPKLLSILMLTIFKKPTKPLHDTPQNQFTLLDRIKWWGCLWARTGSTPLASTSIAMNDLRAPG